MKSELVKDAVGEWLICEADSNDKAIHLKCNFCISMKNKFCLMTSYSNAFVVGLKISGFSKKSPIDLPVMKRKFEVAYFVAKYKLGNIMVPKWIISVSMILLLLFL